MDVDIDVKTTFDPKKWFPTIIQASMLKNGDITKHPCGHYFQTMPTDPVTNLAAIPYSEAEDIGYFKIDMLHLGLLDNFKTKKEIRQLMRKDPDWGLLRQKDVVEKLFHLHNHFDLVNKIRPQSVQEIGDAMALIRPGKKNLVDLYVDDKEYVREHMLYVRSAEDEYTFKRSHAIAYAYNVVLQLHLIEQGRL